MMTLDRAFNTQVVGFSPVGDAPRTRLNPTYNLDRFAVHAHQVYRRNTQTLYVQVGNWFTPLMFAIGLVLLTTNSRKVE